MKKPTANELAKSLLAKASAFDGMKEIVSNAHWDDPLTKARDQDRDVWLRTRMREVKGWTPGAPYCAAFVGAVVCAVAEEHGLSAKAFLSLWTAHCMTNFRGFLKRGLIHTYPVPGSIWLCQQGATDSGHTGFVESVSGFSPYSLATIEGNTSDGSTDNTGDGICRRKRHREKNGKLNTRGFIHTEHLLKLLAPAGKSTTL
jgi:hypothetical protein